MRVRRLIYIGVWLVMGSALAGGCAGGAERLRQITYPPDFHYIDQKEVRGEMERLAADIQRLDDLLRNGEPAGPAQNGQVIAVLVSIRSTIDRLQPAGQKTGHALIDQHLARFRDDVDRARRAAQHQPPNYFFAGNITGSCLYCHGSAR